MVKNIGPGPAQYLLPPSVGYERHDPRKYRNPQFSFGVRTGIKAHTIGPGPGNYLLGKVTRYGERNGPQFSMGRRLKHLGVNIGPGPGAYLCQLDQNAPKFSFGMRTSIPDKNQNPGPDRYFPQLNIFKARAPEFTLAQRLKELTSFRSPGPAAYGACDKNLTHRRCPTYTASGRTPLIMDKTQRPAPNAYNLQAHTPGHSGAKFSFGVRHDGTPMILPADNC